jgi:hypothetical protein
MDGTRYRYFPEQAGTKKNKTTKQANTIKKSKMNNQRK